MSRLNRTYSSPSLRDTANTLGRTLSSPTKGKLTSSATRQEWERNSKKFGHHYYVETDEDENKIDQEFYVIGDRALVDGHKRASVAYFGEVEFAPGDWVGVVMDNPLGNHNGKVHGREYFQCQPFHGLFVRPHRVTRISDSVTSGGHSRSSTPLPTLHQRPHSSTSSSSRLDVGSPAASSVATDSSYFYDDDYRQHSSRLPTIASVVQRMNEIETGSSRPQSRQSNSSLAATPPVGILKKKKSSSYGQTLVEPRSRSETRQKELDDAIDPREPVFNFRPRRARLDQLHHDLQSRGDAGFAGEGGILSDVSNKTTTGIVDLSSEPVQIGDRVWVRSDKGDMSGVLRFMGETNFATGEWAGIELDQAEGKNDGSVLGLRYFYCPQKYGLFVSATRVRKYDGSPGFKAMRSTIKSPPPPKVSVGGIYENSSYNGSSNNGSRSMTPSSYYSSDKTTPSPANGDKLGRHYSSSNITSPNEHDPCEVLARFFDNSYKLETPKFDDNDIDYQLKRSLQRNNDLAIQQPSSFGSTNGRHFDDGAAKLSTRPKCVKYTFSSSKYDGNPIARRTVEYA